MVSDYTAEELSNSYQISVEQALRYIARFGAQRQELDRLLASELRTSVHRLEDINKSSTKVALE